MTNVEKAAPTREFLLLVEDSAEDELMFLREFRQCEVGVDVAIVRDGVEALDFLGGTGKHSGRDITRLPLAVLLDIDLPRVHGLEVLKRIKADNRTGRIAVTILTSSDSRLVALESLRCGAERCLTKPITCGAIEQVARAALRPRFKRAGTR